MKPIRKFFLLLAVTMVTLFSVNAQEKQSGLSKQVADDINNLTEKLYADTKVAIETVYKDSKTKAGTNKVSSVEVSTKTTPTGTGREAVSSVYKDTKNSVGTVYDDSKGVVQTIYSDGKDAVNYITPKVEKAVSEIANGLAVGAEELFKILVMQQVVYSVVYTFVLLALILLCIGLYKESNKIDVPTVQEDIATKSNKLEVIAVKCIIYLTGIVVTASIFFKNIVPFVMGYVNPKYGAIMEILNYAEKFIK